MRGEEIFSLFVLGIIMFLFSIINIVDGICSTVKEKKKSISSIFNFLLVGTLNF